MKHAALRGSLLLSILVLWCGVTAPVCAQPRTDPPSRVLIEGEDLIYNVRYTFIDLGQVRIKNLGRHSDNSFHAYNARALIDSYKGVPFVDLHATFESTIDSAVYSRGFTGKVKQDNAWDFARYNFEYDRHRVIMEMGHRDTVVAERETLSIGNRTQDGLSLFFLARDQLYAGRTLEIPCIITESKVNAFITFGREREEVEVDAVDYPVDVIRFDGTADFVGIFGMTGDFTGWFSNDEARVPILAKMKVLIGSVTIELMSWKRPGWEPPRVPG